MPSQKYRLLSILILNIVVFFFLFSLNFPKNTFAANIEAVLDSADGSSVFAVQDSGAVEVLHIDSDGNVTSKGCVRVDASGAECADSEGLIVDGTVGIGATTASTKLLVNSAAADTTAIVTIQNTGGDFQIYISNGTPNGSITANKGDLAIDRTNGAAYIKTTDGVNTGWSQLATGTASAANTALSNLASVAINTSLISDTDSTDDLGSTTVAWANLYTDAIRTATGQNLTINTDGGTIDIDDTTIDLSTQAVSVSLNAAANSLNFDSNTLSIDASANRVGIGTAGPSTTLHVSTGAANTTAIVTIQNTSGDIQVFRADTTPESSITGSIGDITIDGTSGRLFIKTSGSGTNTGWTQLVTSTGATSLTGLSDVASATATAGRLLVADGTDWESVGLSGDATLTSAGVIDLGASVVGSTEIASTSVTAGSYNAANVTVDADGRVLFAAQGQLTSLSDVGSSTKTAGNLLLADGTNFASQAMSGDCTITSAGVIACSDTSSSGVTLGSYNAANITVNTQGRVTFAAQGQLTSLSDVATSTKTAGNLLVANGTNFASVSVSGDVTLTSAGVLDLGASVVGAPEIASTPVAAGTYLGANLTVDADGRLTFAARGQLTSLSDVNSSTATAGRLLIADGTDWESVAMSGDCSITSAGAVACSDSSSSGVTAGSYNAANISVNSQGKLTFATQGQLTSLSDVATSTKTAGNVLVASGTNFASVAISGDVSITSAGVLDLGASVVGAPEIASTPVAAGTYLGANLTVDADGRLTFAARGQLTSLSDVNSSTATAGRLLIADGTDWESVAMSGDCSITSAGAISCVGSTPTGVTAGTYNAANITVNVGGRITNAAQGQLTSLSDVATSTKTAGNVLVANGTNFASVAISQDATLTSAGVLDIAAGAVGATELSSTTVTAGTYLAANFTVDADGRLIFAARGQLTSLSDVNSSTATAGRLLIADGTDWESVAMSGDCTIISSGVISCSDSSASGVTAGTYNAANITVNTQGRVTNAAQGQLTSLSDVATSTKTAGNVMVANGTNFASVAVSNDATLTSAGVFDLASGVVGSTEIASTTVTAGSYNAANVSVDADGRLMFAAQGQLTSLSDVATSTKTAGNVLVANGTNFASVAVSGDVTLTSAGVVDLASNVVGSSEISSTSVTAGTYTGANITVDGDGRLTFAARGQLTSLSDVNSSTATAGRLLIADGTDWESVAMSGDCTIISSGVISCTDSSASGVTAGTYNAANITVNTQGRVTNAAQGQLTSLSDVATSTKTAGNVLVANGTNFASVAVSNDATITSAGVVDLAPGVVGATELSSTGITAGTYLAANFTVDADGRLVFAARGQLTSLSDVNSSIATAGRLLIADGTDWESVAMSGDCTITSAGAIACSDSSSSGVTAGSYNAANITVNSQGKLTFAAQGQLTSLSDVTTSTKTAGNVLVASGTNFASVAISGDATLTSAGVIDLASGVVGGAEIASTTVTAGSYNAANFTVDADGRLIFAAQGQLTSLSDVTTSTKTAGNVLVANGTNFASVAISGDATLTSAGVIDLASNVVGSSEISSTSVTAATYTGANITVDADGRLVFAARGQLTSLSDVNSSTATAGRLLIADGTDWESIAMSGSCSLTSAGAMTCTDGALSGVTAGTYNAANITVNAQGKLTNAAQGQLTSLSDVATSTKTAGNLMVANGTNFASIALSGDVSGIAGNGAVTFSNDSINASKLASTSVTAGSYNASNITVDADGRLIFAAQGQLTSLSDVATSTKTAGNVLVASGTNFASVAISGDATLTSAGVIDLASGVVGSTEIASTTVTAGTYTGANVTVDADGRLLFAARGQLTSLSDVNSSTATAGRLLIADGTDWESVAMSGDCTITSAGAISCTDTSSSGVTAGSYNGANITVNSQGKLTFAAQGQLTSLSDVTTSTKTAGNVLVANGTNFASVAISGDVAITSAGVTDIQSNTVGSSEIASTAVTAGSINAANITVDADGRLTFAAQGQLTSLSDVASSTKTAGNVLVANGTNFASVAISSDASLTSAGVLDIASAVVGSSEITSTTVTAGTYLAANFTVDADGRLIFAARGQLTSLSDVNSSTATAGRLLIADGTDWESVAMSGDCTIISSGAISCTDTSSSGVTAGTYNAANITVNASGRVLNAAQGQLTSLSDVATSTKTAGNVLAANGTNFASVAISGDVTLTSAGVVDIAAGTIGSSEIASSTVTAGSYNAANFTVDADGRLIFAAQGQLTSLSDVTTSTKTAGNVLVANGTNFASVAISSDATLTSAGVLEIASGVVGSTEIASTAVTAGTYLAANFTVDADGRLIFAARGQLTSLSDVNSSTATAGRLLIADGTDWESVAMSGDCTITSAGAIACNSSSPTGVTAGSYNAANITVNTQGRLTNAVQGQLTSLSDVATSTKTAGNVLVANGTNFASVAISSDITLTSAGVVDLASSTVGSVELASTSVTAGSINAVNITVDADGRLTFAAQGQLTSLSDVASSTKTAGNVLVANGTNFASVALSSDATLTSAGALEIASGVVGSTEIASTTVTAGSYNAANVTVDADGRLIFAARGQLTSLSDVNSSTATAGRLLIADGTDWESVAMSGDCTITSAGAIACNSSTVTGVTAGSYNAANITVNSQGRLTNAAQGQLTSLSDVATSTKTAGNVLVANGTNFASVAISSDITLTSAGVAEIASSTVGSAELASTSVTAGSINAANITVDADGRLTFAAQGQLTSLSDVASSTKTAGNVLVANGTNFASVAVGTDATITSAGVLDLASGVVGPTEITSTTVTAGTYLAASFTVDADGRLIFAARGQLTSLSDVNSSTATAGRLLIADGTDWESVAMGGDCTITSAGAISCTDSSSSGVTAGSYNAANITVNTLGKLTNAAQGQLTSLSDVAASTKTAGNVLVANGTNFASVAISSDITLTSAGVAEIASSTVGSAELASTSVTAGSINAANITVDADGRLTFAAQGQLTSLSDVASSTKTAGNVLVANGTNFASVAVGTDATITSAGVLDLASGVVGSTEITSTTVTAGTYLAANFTVDADGRLTFAARGQLTSLSDVASSTATAGRLLIADGTDWESVAMSGDCTIISSGAISCSSNSATGVTAGSYNAANITVNAQGRLTNAAQGQLTSLSDVASSTKTAGNVLVANGTNFASVAISSDVTLTSAGAVEIASGVVGAAEIASSTVTAGSYNAANFSVDADGRLLFAAQGQLTSLSDVTTSTKTAGNVLVANGTNFASVAVSGDATVTSAGVLDLASGVVGSTEIASSTVTAGTYNAANVTVDADGRLTFAARGQLTSLSDVNSSTATAGRLLIADGTDWESVALSGECSITSAGVISCTGNTATGVTAGSYNAANITVSAEGRLTNAAQGQLTSLSDVASSTKTAGNLLVANGTNFASVAVSGDVTLTSAGAVDLASGTVGASELTSTSVTAGSINAANITVDADGRLIFAAQGQLTSLSDVTTSTKTAGNVLVANGTNFASVAVSGDATITSAGVLDLASGVVGSTEIASSTVTAGTYNAANVTVDADGRLTFAARGQLTSLSDVNSSTATAGRLLIADGTDWESVAMSGDCSITSAGAMSCAGNTTTGVTAGSYNAANITVTAQGRLTNATQGQLTSLSDVASSTKTAGNVLVASGTNFASVAISSDVTLTSAGAVEIASGVVGAAEIASSTVTAGSYNAANFSVDADGRLLFAAQGQLTSLSDVASSTKTAGNVLVANGTNFASVAISGDATITSAGAVDIASGVVGSTEVASTTVTAGTYLASNFTVDADGRLLFAARGQLTSLSDVNSSTATAGRLLIADGTDWESVAMGGDCSITSAGAITCTDSTTGVTAGSYNAANITVTSGGRLTFSAQGQLTSLSDVASSTKTAGNVLVANGTNFASVAISSDVTLTSAGAVEIASGVVGAAEIASSTVTAGSYNAANFSIDADGRLLFAAQGQLTSLSDVASSTKTAGNVLVANGTNFASVAISGDATITSAGAVDIASGVVGSTEIASTTVTAGTYLASNFTVDADGRLIFAARGQLTSLSDVNSSTATAGRLLIADGTDWESVAMGGDCSITSAGAITCTDSTTGVTAGSYNAANITVTSGGRLTFSAQGQLTSLSDVASSTKTAGNLLVANGTNFASVAISSDVTLTSAGAVEIASGVVGAAEIASSTVTAGSYNAANFSVDADGRLLFAAQGQLTSLSDVASSTKTAGNVLVANGTNFASVAISGDATITSAGAVDIASGVVGSTEIASTTVTAGTYLASNFTVDADGRLIFAARGQLTSLSDVNSSTATAGRVLIADGTDWESVAMGGDCVITSAGAVSCTDTSSSGVTAGTYNGANITVNSQGRMTFAARGQLTSLSDVASSTKTAGNFLVANGTNFASVAVSDDATITSAGVIDLGSNVAGAPEVVSTTVTAGSYNAANVTVDADGRMNFVAQGQLTSLSDVASSTKTAGNFLVANGTNFASVALSVDATITSAGVVDLASSSVGSNEITSTSVTAGTYLAANFTVDADGRLIFAARGQLTALSDVNSATATAGRVLVANGTDWESVAISGDCSLTSAGVIDCSDSSSSSVTPGTYNAANITVNTIGKITNAAQGQLTSLSDVASSTKTAGHVLMANGTNFISSALASDFGAISSAGVVQFNNNSIQARELVSTSVTAGSYNASDMTVDADGRLTFAAQGQLTSLGDVVTSTKTAGNLLVANGTNFASVVMGTDATITSAGVIDLASSTAGATELSSTTVTAGTYLAANFTVDADGRLLFAARGQLTSLSDVNSATATAGRLLIADGTDWESVAMSSSCTITSAGVMSCSDNSATGVTAGSYNTADITINSSGRLTYAARGQLTSLSDVTTSTKTAGNVLAASGTNFASVAMSGNISLTSAGAVDIAADAVGSGDITSTTVTAGSYNAANFSVDADGRMIFAAQGQLTSLSDIATSTKTAGNLLVANGTNFASVDVSGDATISSAGVVDLASGTVGSLEIASTSVTAATVNGANITVDADGRLTFAARGQLTSLSDVNSSTATAGRLLIADGTDWESVAMSSSCSITSAGAMSCSDNSSSGVTAGSYDAANITVTTQGKVRNAAQGQLTSLSDVASSTKTAGNVLVASGTNFASVAVSGDATLTSAGSFEVATGVVGSSEITSTTITAASYNAADFSVDADGRIIFAAQGQLTSLGDVATSTKTAGNILVANGTNFASVAASNDATVTSAGVVDLAADTVGPSEIASTTITAGSYNAANLTVDADGRLNFAARGQLTSLSDVGSSTATAGRILVADGTDWESVGTGGDCSINSAGVLSCAAGLSVTGGSFNAANLTVDTLGRVTFAAQGQLTSLSDAASSTKTAGNVLVANGTNFASVAVSGDATLTSAGALDVASGVVGSTEITSTTVTAGSYNAANFSVDADGRMIFAAQGQLTSLSDVATSTKTAGNLLLANGTNFASVAISGDATITSAGAVDLAANAVGSPEMTSATVTAGTYPGANITVDADGRLTFAVRGQLTSLSDVNSSTATAGNLLVADGTDWESVVASGDCAIDSAGAISCSGGTSPVTAGTYNAANITVNSFGRLTYAAQGQLTSLSDVATSTKTAGNLLVANGTNFASVAAGTDATLTSAGAFDLASDSVGPAEITSTTITAGSYNAANFSVDADGRLIFAAQGQLTSLSDVATSTKTAGNLLIANGTNFASVAVSGDATLTSAGALDLASGVVGSTELASTTVTAGTYLGTNVTVDADGRLTFAARGQLTSLSDVNSATATAGRLLIADGTDWESVAPGGDCSITSAGAMSCSSSTVVTAGTYNAANITANAAGRLTFAAQGQLTSLSDVASSTKTAGNVLVANGTNFASVAVGGDAALTSAGGFDVASGVVGSSEITSTTVTAGSYNAANFTVDADGRLIFAAQGQLTSLSDVVTSTKTAGNLLVANGTNFASVAISGDATITSAGAIDLAANTVGSTEIASTSVTSGTFLGANATVDADGRLTFAARGQLTSLTDVNSSTATAGRLLIADGTDWESAGMGGDCSIISSGAITCAAGISVTGGSFNAANITVDTLGRVTFAAQGQLTSLSDVATSTKTAGNLLIANGTNFASVAVSGDATLTSAGAVDIASGVVGSAEIASSTVIAGSYNAANFSVDADGRLIFAAQGQLTSLSDVASSTKTAGNLLVANGTNFASAAVSADATLTSAGVVDLASGVAGSSELASTTVTAGTYNAANVTVDADGRLTFAARGQLTSLSDVNSSTATAGRLLIADGTDWESVVMSGSCSLTSAGVITCSGSSGVTAGTYNAANITVNATGRMTNAAQGQLTSLSDVAASTTTAGNLLIANGTNFASAAVGTDATLTSAGVFNVATDAVGSPELASTTVTAGSYNAANFSVDADGRLIFAAQGQLTSLSDVATSTKTAGNLLVANGTNFASVAVSADATLTSAGVVDLASGVAGSSELASTTVTAGTYNAANVTVDADGRLTFAARGQLTSLSDVNSSTATAGNLLVADGTDWEAIALSGDCSLTSAGAITCNNGLSSGVTAGTYNTANVTVNAEGKLTFAAQGQLTSLSDVATSTKTAGNVLVASGTNFASVAISSDVTLTSAGAVEIASGVVGAAEIASSTVTAGSYNAANFSVDADGRLLFAAQGQLTSLSDVASSTKTAGNLLVANGTNFASVAAGTDATLTSAGVIDLASGVVGSTEITSTTVTAGTYNATNVTVDADGRLTFAARGQLTSLSDVNSSTATAGRLLIADGTDWESVAMSGTCTITSAGAVSCDQSSSVTAGSYNAANITVNDKGRILFAGQGQLTSLSDVATSTKTAGNVLVANGTNFASVAVGTDATITSAGVFNVASDAVGSPELASTTVTAGSYNAVNFSVDADGRLIFAAQGQLTSLSDVASSTKTAGNLLVANGTNFASVAAGTDATLTSAGVIDLASGSAGSAEIASTSVTAGTYLAANVTVDADGRLTFAARGQLTSLSDVNSSTATAGRLLIADGTDWESVALSGDCLITSAGVVTCNATTTVTAGSYNAVNITVNDKGRLLFAAQGQLTSLSDVATSTKTAGNVLVANGTNFASVAVSSDVTLTSAGAVEIASGVVGAAEIASSTVTAGSYNAANFSVDADGRLLFAAQGQLTSLSDVASSTKTAGNLLIANGTNFASVAVSGDATITSAGAVDIASGVVGSTEIASTTVTAGTYLASNFTVDADGRLIFAARGQLTSLSDVNSSTATAGRLLIADGTDWESVALSGDCSIISSGAITCTDSSTGVTAGSYNAANVTVSSTGKLTFAAQGQLTSLSDVATSTKTAGNLLVANGTNFASVAISGDATLTSAGAVSNLKVQSGTGPTVSAAGNIGVDTTDDQLTYYGASAKVVPYKHTRCGIVEDVAAVDDNFALGSFVNGSTITSVWCTCTGTCTTKATFTLEDGAANAMTITGTNPTCTDMGTVPTAAAVTAANGLTANEALRFDVTNTPNPETDTYEVCVSYTIDSQ